MKSKYEQYAEAQERLEYAMYKVQHDRLNKLYFESYSGEKYPESMNLPSYEEWKASK